MIRFFLTIIIGISLFSVSAETYHVDVLSKSHGIGTPDAPFKTISEAIRILKPGDTCLIHEGVYRETLSGIPSGTSETPITITRFKDDKVVISGCDPVSGWKKDKGNIYAADVNMTLGVNNQVFYKRDMVWEARWPNAGGVTPRYLLEFKQAKMEKGTKPELIVSKKIPERDWTGASVWVSSFKRWYSWTSKIKSFKKGALEVFNNTDPGGNHICKLGGVFYIFGCKAALDSENEWWYDSEKKKLYICVPGGENPGNQVEVKARKTAIDLAGTSNVILKGFTVFGASITTNDKSEGIVLDNLRILYFYHSNKAEKRYGSQSYSGITLKGKNNRIQNCEIAYSSGNGLALGGWGMQSINNYIHDCNYMGTYCSPLEFKKGGGGHLVSNNTITRAGRSCIGTPGFYNSILQYNDIGFAGYLTWDLGLTYGNGVDGGNSEVRYNWFHDNLSRDHCNGIYFDHGCKNLIIHHNVVWNVKNKGLNNNQYGNYLLYYHNTVSDAEYGYASRWAAAQAQDLYGCRIKNNLATGKLKFKGEGLVEGKNLWEVKGIVDKKFPGNQTGAKDKAEVIEGLRHETIGPKPDFGAYEMGGTRWKAGHDFKNPPVNIDTEPTKPAFRNLLENPAWYGKETADWTLNGECKTISDKKSQWIRDGLTMISSCGIRMGPAKSSVSQKVTGLKPNTTYELMGMFRVESGAEACLSVTHGLDRKSTPKIDVTIPKTQNPIKTKSTFQKKILEAKQKNCWRRALLRFTTGPKQTEATIAAECLNGGTGFVYIDDMGLQLVGEKSSGSHKK